MSRSYKKFPIFRDNLWGKSMKKGKQYNNRKIKVKTKQNTKTLGLEEFVKEVTTC